MKRLLLLLFFSCFAAVSFAQTTYYWVGGTSEANIGTASNWNTQLNGTGTSRSTILSTDVLVVDGTNIGGAVQTTGTALIHVNAATTAQLKIINGASVNLVRVASSNGTLTIANNTLGEAGLTIDATSSLLVNNASYVGNLYIDFPATATGSIAGTFKITQGGSTVASSSPRITCRTVGGLVFTSGATFDYDNTLNYPFGSVGSGTNNSSNGAVVFQNGANLICNSIFSPFGNSSTSAIVDFRPGSNYYIKKTITTGSVTNAKTFGNVFLQNGATLTTDGAAMNKIENFTIDAGCNVNVNGSTSTPIPLLGNLVANGNINGTTSGAGNFILSMSGSSPQTISGSGNIAVTGFVVGDHSTVTLEKNITVVGSSNIYGTLNFGTFQIDGAGSFTSRVAFESASGTSYTNAANTITDGSYQITIPVSLGLSSLTGLEITGPGIQANTNIVSYSSGNGQVNLSKPATASSVGATISFKSNTSTLITSNVNGLSATGSIAASGTVNNNAGTNVVFNAATVSPFTTSNNALGNVTFNAAATTNKNITVTGKLTLNNSKLTIREADVLTMGAAATFDSGLGANAYVVTSANTSTGDVGKIKLTDITTSTVIPVGTATNYLPVTLSPTTASTFEVNVFAGATADGTPNGTALTAAQKLRMVDAVWNVVRTSGSGNADLTVNWPNALEGADFSLFGNTSIGIANYNAGVFGTFAGLGNAVANTAAINTGNFSAFIVGEANTTLPLTMLGFSVKQNLNTVKLDWRTTDEKDLKNYVLQHKRDGNYETIYTANPNNKPGIFNYSFVHPTPLAGTNYYRLVAVDLDGTTHTFDEAVKVNLTNAMSVYPNPAIGNSITVSGVVKGDVIKLQNIQGQVITRKVANNNTEQIDVQSIAAGTYLISIENEGKTTSTKKVIKI
ncbi:T9SS type A sorting domain-containing protein [Nubsella zeaxanthinifaciens]|uniref:T9SS type A sorting domain-containing protein n=1 Tax=Nubsella zeaxanthinifaciens TaxID=392412 RepID=UPI003D04C324